MTSAWDGSAPMPHPRAPCISTNTPFGTRPLLFPERSPPTPHPYATPPAPLPLQTALVEGLAQRIAAGDVPDTLRDVSLMALDMGLLMAGGCGVCACLQRASMCGFVCVRMCWCRESLCVCVQVHMCV